MTDSTNPEVILSEQSPEQPESTLDASLPIADLDVRNAQLVQLVQPRGTLSQLNKRRGAEKILSGSGLRPASLFRRQQQTGNGLQRNIDKLESRADGQVMAACGACALKDTCSLAEDPAAFRDYFSDSATRAKLFRRVASDDPIKRAVQCDAIAPSRLVNAASVTDAVGEMAELGLLDTRSKLEGLRDDPRASFLPTTHREKNQAIELLDYIPDVNLRLTEIFYRQQREAQYAGRNPRDSYGEALVSIESIINEWGDYQADALRALDQLRPFKKALDDCENPEMKLASVLEEMDQPVHPGYIIRFIDLLRVREKGIEPGFDPLLTKEDRTVDTTTRNKQVHDVYAGLGQGSLAMEAYLTEQVEKITVRQLRYFAPAAFHDAHRRAVFWENILKNIQDDKEGFARYARDVEVRVARQNAKNV